MGDDIHTEIFNHHLPYEIDMLRGTYRKLTTTTELDCVHENALIEAFCIHARSLLDFFMCNKRKFDDDAEALDFTTEFTPLQSSDRLEEIRTIINKRVIHLTKKRTIVQAEKFDVASHGTEIAQLLEAEIARLIPCLRPEFVFKCKTQPLEPIPGLKRSIQTTHGELKFPSWFAHESYCVFTM